MGKRKRHKEVNAEGGGANPVENKGKECTADSSVGKNNIRTRNKKEVTASPANKENLVNGELKGAVSSQKVSPGAAKSGKGRKRVTGKSAARQSKEETSFQGGELGTKKTFSWTSAQEIIFLSELLKSTIMDTGQSLDKSNIDWEQLATTVGQKLDHNLTRTQIYEKARRLKERYTRTHERGNLKSFKNEDDEKMYKLSQQIWGSSGATRSLLEEECYLLFGNSEKKFCEPDNIDKGDSLPDDAEVQIPGITMEKECAPKTHQKDPVSPSEPKQGTTVAHEQANPDSSQSKIHAIEGDTQKTFEVFHAEHQALLKELEKSCVTVLQDMQVKFLSMMNNTVRGSQFPWIGGGVCVPTFDSAHLSWDKLVDNCLSTSTNKPAAFENLYEQWQQQRLQELKLTSMKLQLMLEDCKMEQEKLENQVSKS